jgi:hypothetical protein
MRLAEEYQSDYGGACIISKPTEGTCLTNLDKDRGRGGQIKLIWGRIAIVKINLGCI